MDVSTGDLPVLVFRRAVRDDLAEFSFDGQMLSVLMELDGQKNLGEIASKTGLKMSDIRIVIGKLLDLKLIEPVEEAISVLDGDFFDYLEEQLSLAVGPIASILIEDSVTDLGHSISRFPSHRAAELVDLLDRQIQREEKRIVFKQNMVQRIREKTS